MFIQTKCRCFPDHGRMSSLQPAQFQNPFVTASRMMTSAGPSGWFRRRAELRHAYNLGLINQHFTQQDREHAAGVERETYAAKQRAKQGTAIVKAGLKQQRSRPSLVVPPSRRP